MFHLRTSFDSLKLTKKQFESNLDNLHQMLTKNPDIYFEFRACDRDSNTVIWVNTEPDEGMIIGANIKYNDKEVFIESHSPIMFPTLDGNWLGISCDCILKIIDESFKTKLFDHRFCYDLDISFNLALNAFDRKSFYTILSNGVIYST